MIETWHWLFREALEKITPILQKREINKEHLVANVHRVGIFCSSTLDVGGGFLYAMKDGSWLISVSARSNRLEREKTIWHEFAHWVAGRGGVSGHDADWIEIVTALGFSCEAKREKRKDETIARFYRKLAGRTTARSPQPAIQPVDDPRSRSTYRQVEGQPSPERSTSSPSRSADTAKR